jgi:hypothetical protein
LLASEEILVLVDGVEELSIDVGRFVDLWLKDV